MSTAADASHPTTDFGPLPEEAGSALLFTLTCGAVTARFTDYGARLLSLEAPDRDGKVAHVVLGFDSAAAYAEDKSYQGAVVGRYGNRIARGKFTLGGQVVEIPQNNGVNALHGGPVGFSRKLWQGKEIGGGLEFTLVSPAGDMGFPGTLTATIRYTLVEAGAGVALNLDYTATTDAETVVNLTNHAYFNLSGVEGSTILDHEIAIFAEHFTPTDANLIPTGELAPVAGTPFDFREATGIGLRIGEPHEQLVRAGGYDHNWVFGENGVMKTAAKVYEPTTGRTLTVETSEPGMQFYSGNFLVGAMPNRDGGVYGFRSGFCLETQHYPDSPNQPDFPSTTLRPGETLRSTTIFTFGVNA